MTVSEVIEALEKIENKSLKVFDYFGCEVDKIYITEENDDRKSFVCIE